MTRHKMLSISTVAVCSLLALGIALGPNAQTHADTMPSLFNGLVFAHDMENAWIHGTTGRYNIAGVHGTPTAEVYLGGASAPFSFGNQPSTLSFSQQHLKTPPLVDTNNPRGYVNTNTHLVTPSSELSFSFFYNLDPNAAQLGSGKRFLTTYRGSGGVLNTESLFDVINFNSADTTHRIRLYAAGESKTWNDAVSRDGNWHHIGFVFNSGTARLYVDGLPFGTDQTFSAANIPAQDRSWRLLEESEHNELFMDSSFDEAGLWYRALSDTEMLFLYQNGLASIPEPSTLLLLAMAGLAFACASGRRRK